MTVEQRCKAHVYHPGRWTHSTCSRKAVSDGYCTQHHPDTEARKKKERDDKWNASCKAREDAANARQAKIARLIDLSCEEARQIIAELNLR